MLTGTDVVEKMGPGSELKHLTYPVAATGGYPDQSHQRRRSIEANIFSERRGNNWCLNIAKQIVYPGADGRGFVRKTSHVDYSYGMSRVYPSISTRISGAQYALVSSMSLSFNAA